MEYAARLARAQSTVRRVPHGLASEYDYRWQCAHRRSRGRGPRGARRCDPAEHGDDVRGLSRLHVPGVYVSGFLGSGDPSVDAMLIRLQNVWLDHPPDLSLLPALSYGYDGAQGAGPYCPVSYCNVIPGETLTSGDTQCS